MIADNQTFTGKRVQLDGVSLTNCKVNGCRLVYAGLMGIELRGTSFEGCRYEFEGPALQTIQFMRTLYHAGGDSAALIESIFDEIRQPLTARQQTN